MTGMLIYTARDGHLVHIHTGCANLVYNHVTIFILITKNVYSIFSRKALLHRVKKSVIGLPVLTEVQGVFQGVATVSYPNWIFFLLPARNTSRSARQINTLFSF